MLLSNLNEGIVSFFTKGHERSVKAKKNIIASFFIKCISIIIGFLMVPLCLNYLDQTRYGIWLTMSSFLGWFTFFEIGLGSGLRNKLAESLAIKDYFKGKIYVSTTYAILSLVALIVAVVFTFINPFLNWTKILNTDPALYGELKILALIVFNFFFLRFLLKLIGIVLYADQKPAYANAIGPTGNLLSLIIIFVLTKTTKGSLIYLGITLSIAPVIIMLIVSFVLYSGKYKIIAPSLKNIQMKYAKDILHLGVKFFLIQIAGLVIYQTSNIIIAQFFGPAQVTPYNIAYKLFSIINMVFAIAMMPFWSAFTEAWTVKDIDWIKRSISKLLKIWLLLVIFGFILLAFSPWIYKIWVGESIQIPFILSISLFIYFSLFTFGGIFNMFINGVGKIYIQMMCSFLAVTMFIVTAFLLIKYTNFGIASLAIAMIVSNFYGVIIAPIQFNKIVNEKAKGIWDK